MQQNWINDSYAKVVLYFCLPSAFIIFDDKNSSAGITNASHLFIADLEASGPAQIHGTGGTRTHCLPLQDGQPSDACLL